MFGVRWLEQARGLDTECKLRDTDGNSMINMVRDGPFCNRLVAARNFKSSQQLSEREVTYRYRSGRRI